MNESSIRRLKRQRESITADLAAARDRLASEAATAASIDLGHRLSALAEHEGKLAVHDLVRRMIDAGSEDRVCEELIAMATLGAEDRWSGRTNDVARARFDGVLHAIRDVSAILNDC